MAATRESNKTSRLDDLSRQGLAKVIKYYADETAKCVELTKGTVLSDAEYNNASADFKSLVNTPRKNGEPIYIMPELDDKGHLAKPLKELRDNIIAGKPYSTFISSGFGTMWPLLLRLFYGLNSCDFRISIEQFHSMIKVCYWKDVNLEVKSINFFKTSTELSIPAQSLLQTLHFAEPDKQKKQFIQLIKEDKSIANAEKDLIVIRLNADYFRGAMFSTLQTTDLPQDHITVMQTCDMFFSLTHGAYSQDKTFNFIKTQAAEMFAIILGNHNFFYRMAFSGLIDGVLSPYLILPSQSMLSAYFQVVNPERKLKIARVLGVFGPTQFEDYVDKNSRPVNLYAPGIENMLIAHRKPIMPAFGLEHDDYHAIYEGTISPVMAAQLDRTKTLLRQIIPDRKVLTADIFRLLDREQPPLDSDLQRYMTILAYAFFDKGLFEGGEITLSITATLVLADLLLNPKEWENQQILQNDMLKALHLSNNEELLKSVIKKTKLNGQINDVVFFSICISILIKFKDQNTVTSLYTLKEKYPQEIFCAWRVKPHGNLYPVLIINGKDVHLEAFGKLTPSQRIGILLSVKPDIKFQHTNVIELPILEWDSIKEKSVKDNNGQVISVDTDKQSATIKIASAALTKPVRDVLGLGRVKISGTERAEHLKKCGMTVESAEDNKYLITFFAKQQSVVTEVAKVSWQPPSTIMR